MLLARYWFRQIGCSEQTVFFAALCFAIHPQRVESVVWIAERKDVCFAFFFLLTLVLQERARTAQKPASAASAAAMLAALLCKPAAIVLPGILALMEWRRSRKWCWKTIFRQLIWHGAAAVCWMMISMSLFRDAAGHAGRYGLRIWTALRNVFLYGIRTWIPTDLMPVHPFYEPTFTDQVCLTAGVILLALGGFLLYRKKRQFFLFSLLPLTGSALLAALPTLGLLVFSNSDFADRYSYLPSLFLWGLAGLAATLFQWEKARLFRPAACGAATVYAICTLLYLPVWQSDESAMEISLTAEHPNLQAVIAAAGLLLERGEMEQAAQLYFQTPKRGRAPWMEAAFDRYLSLVLLRGKPEELSAAMEQYRNQEADWEMLKKLYYASAMIFGRAQSNLELALGRPDKAALAMEKTAELYPEDPFLCAFHRGVAAMFRNDPASAAAHFEDALRIHPDDDFTRKNYEAARNKIVTAP